MGHKRLTRFNWAWFKGTPALTSAPPAFDLRFKPAHRDVGQGRRGVFLGGDEGRCRDAAGLPANAFCELDEALAARACVQFEQLSNGVQHGLSGTFWARFEGAAIGRADIGIFMCGPTKNAKLSRFFKLSPRALSACREIGTPQHGNAPQNASMQALTPKEKRIHPPEISDGFETEAHLSA